MRRTTLGPTNPSSKGKEKATTRPRFSFSGSRHSTSRPSSSFGGGSRRSSQYGRDSYAQMKDPRPISDKSYQQREIKDLIQFLSENEYEHKISGKVLSCPTTKEFLKVFMFVHSFLNSDQAYEKVIMKRPDEEVPKILKSLGYPFTIHKTSLSNVGSPHTWPILLAALHWLMNLVKFALRVHENVDQHLFPLDEDDDFGERNDDRPLYLEYLGKSYEAFLNGVKLDDLGSFTDSFQEEIRERNLPVIAEVETLAQENAKLEKELAELEEKSSKLEATLEKKSSLENDKVKFESYLSDLRRHKVKMEEKVVESEESLNALKLEEQATAAERQKLERDLATQELSAADVQRMKREKDELKKKFEKLEADVDKIDQETWETEMTYAKSHEQCLALIEDYNKGARKLKLIPATAENAAGADYEMKCVRGRLNVNFSDVLKPNLVRFKKQLSESNRRYQSEIFSLKEKRDQLQEIITEKDEDIKALEKDVKTVENDYEWKKQVYDQKYQKLTELEEKLQKELQEMRQTSTVTVSEKQKELQDLKEKVRQRREEMCEDKAQYEMFLRAVGDKVINHKMIIQNRIAGIRKDCDEFLSREEQRLVSLRAASGKENQRQAKSGKENQPQAKSGKENRVITK